MQLIPEAQWDPGMQWTPDPQWAPNMQSVPGTHNTDGFLESQAFRSLPSGRQVSLTMNPLRYEQVLLLIPQCIQTKSLISRNVATLQRSRVSDRPQHAVDS